MADPVKVPFGKTGTVKFRFTNASGGDAQVQNPILTTTLGAASDCVFADGKWSGSVTSPTAGLASVSVTADVDLGDGVNEMTFPLADFLFEDDGTAKGVSDVEAGVA